LEQNENEESEVFYAHNNTKTNPSLFNDVEESDLRHANRGAIMANIFERFTTENAAGVKQLLPKDFSTMTRDMDAYLTSIPSPERGKAKQYMRKHLTERGYYAA